MSLTIELKNQPMTMKNPPPPGVVVSQECIEPMGLPITDAARALGVDAQRAFRTLKGPAFRTMKLDDLITSRAKAYADRLTATAQRATKEEEIRVASERELGSIQDAAGIKLEGRHEFTVASGFVDSVYDRVLIEYKIRAAKVRELAPRSTHRVRKRLLNR